MKRFMQVLSVMCVAAIAQAVDFEKVDSMNLSSPGSIKPMAQRLDRNFEAAETVLDALSTTYQPLDSDLTDLADGSLTGSKVGTGIPAGNVTSGNLPFAVMSNALVGAVSGDATISEAGSVSLASRSVAGAELPIATVGQILVGQADSNALVKTLSGAVTVDANGVATIAPTTTVTRLVASGTMTLDGRTPVVGYSTQPLVMDFFVGVTNGQTITFAGGMFGSFPSVTASYSTTSSAQSPTGAIEIHSKTASNCVVVCEAGKTVDVMVIGGRNY